MILTKTSTKTDKSSSCQERLISLSPNLIFRTTPFYFVTYRPDPLCASKRVWLRKMAFAARSFYHNRISEISYQLHHPGCVH